MTNKVKFKCINKDNASALYALMEQKNLERKDMLLIFSTIAIDEERNTNRKTKKIHCA